MDELDGHELVGGELEHRELTDRRVGNAADDTSVKIEVWGKLEDGKISGRFELTAYDSDGNEVGGVKGTFEGEPLDA